MSRALLDIARSISEEQEYAKLIKTDEQELHQNADRRIKQPALPLELAD